MQTLCLLLFTLDDVVGLSFDGKMQSNSQLTPESISIKLNNNRVDEVVSDWEIVRQEYLNDFDKALSAIKKGNSMGVNRLMYIINLDLEGNRLQELEMSLIAGDNAPLASEITRIKSNNY